MKSVIRSNSFIFIISFIDYEDHRFAEIFHRVVLPSYKEPRACVIGADFVFFMETGVVPQQQRCVGHALYGLESYVIMCRSCYGKF